MQKKKQKKSIKVGQKDLSISKNTRKREETENTGGNEFGGLPLHDLKKNLGCC
jgi:hypothetical protein